MDPAVLLPPEAVLVDPVEDEALPPLPPAPALPPVVVEVFPALPPAPVDPVEPELPEDDVAPQVLLP